MLWLIVVIILSGLVIGGLARLALPGPDPMPWWATVLLGWAGSLLAGVVAYVLFGRGAGLILSVLGSIVLLALYRKYVQRRPLSGSGARRL